MSEHNTLQSDNKEQEGFVILSSPIIKNTIADQPNTNYLKKLPVVFVHGLHSNAGTWGIAINFLDKAGWDTKRIFAWDYDTSMKMEQAAFEFNTYIKKVVVPAIRGLDGLNDNNEIPKFNIVAHSWGSMCTRWYIKFLGGTSYVSHWVSLGGPNHGVVASSIAGILANMSVLGHYVYNNIVRLVEPAVYELKEYSDPLNKLNFDIEAPGPTYYTTIRSSSDGIIMPSKSTALDDVYRKKGCSVRVANIECHNIKHNDLLVKDEVLQHVIDALLFDTADR
nr:hypothetical protein [Elizabethkingia sp. ASV34]